jgi:NAD-dependent deacetylase
MKKKLVVLSGAGISAESGLSTFRGAGGLWEGHDIMDVASPEGWYRDPELVLRFYNARRRALKDVQPNRAHEILAELEELFDVHVITQNVDDLHERGGSSRIMHLHGELLKARGVDHEDVIYDWHDDIRLGDTCERGSQLRPHIVWFGEAVPMIEQAALVSMQADIYVVIGTSLVVYPAASLVQYAPTGIPIYVIDPNRPELYGSGNVTFITENATVGAEQLKEILTINYGT